VILNTKYNNARAKRMPFVPWFYTYGLGKIFLQNANRSDRFLLLVFYIYISLKRCYFIDIQNILK